MKTPHSTLYRYTAETVAAANKIPPGCVDEQSHKLGMTNGEPLIIILDSLVKYAEAHRVRFESNLAEDYVLGPMWLDALKATRGLLNGNGAYANMIDRSTDSKSNGSCEDVFWAAARVAGYEESEMGL